VSLDTLAEPSRNGTTQCGIPDDARSIAGLNRKDAKIAMTIAKNTMAIAFY
jgi:hypothetical protein